eukprot:m.247824 g.247824  ORF g.247824 m.247824 type:complete len:50 (-) comp26662_c0_seq8:96-245(-)
MLTPSFLFSFLRAQSAAAAFTVSVSTGPDEGGETIFIVGQLLYPPQEIC